MTAEKRSRTTARPRTTGHDKVPASDDAQISAALRNAYEEAVKEEVPTEFLDLLGKLS